MTAYKCFDCGKEIKFELARKKVRCPYCGSKILYKTTSVNSVVRAV